MAPDDSDERLSRLATRLSIWVQAHQGEGSAVVAARQQLLLRYHNSVYRYLLGMVRDAAAAEDLTQEFAVRVLRGDFKGFDPKRGRFRDFLKGAVRHLVIDHWKQKQRPEQPQALPPELAEPAADVVPEDDRVFLGQWKEELLGRTWEALKAHERETGQAYATVLQCRTNHPEMASSEMARLISVELGRDVSAENLRQLLLRARRRFADLLVEEVAHSLQTEEPDRITEELIELGLMSYCRSAVTRGTRPA